MFSLSNSNIRRTAAAAATVENLLHGLVAHLSGGEALKGHDGRVGAVTQQQFAGLDVTGQRRPVERRLAEGVHGVHLQPHGLKSTHSFQTRVTENKRPNPN